MNAVKSVVNFCVGNPVNIISEGILPKTQAHFVNINKIDAIQVDEPLLQYKSLKKE